MREALDRLLEEAGEAIGAYLPRIAGALVVLVVGLVAVRYLGRGLSRL
jgi:Conserved TM helix